MNCKTARGLFSSWIDGELSQAKSQELQQHLHDCPSGCAARWASFEATVRILHALPTAEPDPTFVGQVLDRVRAYEAGRIVVPDGRGGVAVWLRWRDSIRVLFRPPVAAPLRVAGALAFGVVAGFFVAHEGFPPASMGSSPMASVARGGRTVSSAMTRVAPVRAASNPDRPFGDLADELSTASLGQSGGDSAAESSERSIRVVPAPPEGPGSPGQQVLTGASDGHPQITF